MKISTFGNMGAFGNMGEMGEKSTAGYIMLVRSGDYAAPVNLSTNIIRKVVTSTMGAETLAMDRAIKEGVYMREMLEEITGNKPVDDKRLIKYIAVIRQTLQEKEAWEVEWIPSHLNISDPLTKETNDLLLIRTMQTGKRIDHTAVALGLAFQQCCFVPHYPLSFLTLSTMYLVLHAVLSH